MMAPQCCCSSIICCFGGATQNYDTCNNKHIFIYHGVPLLVPGWYVALVGATAKKCNNLYRLINPMSRSLMNGCHNNCRSSVLIKINMKKYDIIKQQTLDFILLLLVLHYSPLIIK